MVRLAVVFAFASAVGAARVQVDIAAAEEAAEAAAQAVAEAIAEEDSVEADDGQWTCPIGRRVRNPFGNLCAMVLSAAGSRCTIQYGGGRIDEVHSMHLREDARCPQPTTTTTTTTTTTMRPWMTEPSLVIADGCPNQQGQQGIDIQPANTGQASVRCCSLDGAHCETQTVGCLTGVSFFEANAACHSHGLRLCSLQELDGGVCCGTGCGYDGRRVWTFTPAEAIWVPPTPICEQASIMGGGFHDVGRPDGASAIQFIDLGNGAMNRSGQMRSIRYTVARADQAGLKFQVYRPISGNAYELVMESEALASPGQGSIATHQLARPLEYQAGDYIGWVHTGQGTFNFHDHGGSVRWRYGIRPVGSRVDFNGGGARVYSYEATMC